MTVPEKRGHGDTLYPVMGETDRYSGDVFWAIKTSFAMLPDTEVWEAIHKLRDLNDMHGHLLGEESPSQRAHREMSCGTKGPDVYIDADIDDLHMYPQWLRHTIGDALAPAAVRPDTPEGT